MATHSSTLAWRIPWTEEPGRAQRPQGHKESDMIEETHENNLSSISFSKDHADFTVSSLLFFLVSSSRGCDSRPFGLSGR